MDQAPKRGCTSLSLRGSLVHCHLRIYPGMSCQSRNMTTFGWSSGGRLGCPNVTTWPCGESITYPP
ncbi:hypothetical protein COLO4_28931 [Corchorus olitorius]|uniref:Uncharacterized protein n=1 Tax=Corchorus olitorius TaxID=93759 RepID=A0A1R3HHD7_9ROSI|nr:hypothetical protein COLO4_28931 [Corchorus olitorius]